MSKPNRLIHRRPQPTHQSSGYPHTDHQPLSAYTQHRQIQSSTKHHSQSQLNSRARPSQPLRNRAQPKRSQHPGLAAQPHLPQRRSRAQTILPSIPRKPTKRASRQCQNLHDRVRPPTSSPNRATQKLRRTHAKRTPKLRHQLNTPRAR